MNIWTKKYEYEYMNKKIWIFFVWKNMKNMNIWTKKYEYFSYEKIGKIWIYEQKNIKKFRMKKYEKYEYMNKKIWIFFIWKNMNIWAKKYKYMNKKIWIFFIWKNRKNMNIWTKKYENFSYEKIWKIWIYEQKNMNIFCMKKYEKYKYMNKKIWIFFI